MRIRTATLALFAGLTCAGLGPGALAAPPENRVAISAGHRIAFHVYPGRQPAIVLDAGGGLDARYWDSLIPDLAKATGSEIITYDRSGFGESDEVPGPWNVMTARDDLIAVLKAAKATRKVVLVSHSLAGEIALYAVRAHPDWFAGAVLVDANVPQLFTDEMIHLQTAAMAPQIERLKAAPPTPSSRQLLALSQSFETTSRAFHAATWPRSVPAAVIVSEKTPLPGPTLAQTWRAAHAEFAAAAPNRTLITAAHSSHDVAHDRPDVIIDAVKDLVAQARRQP